jgi:3-oxoadipate enol-lactonase
MQVARINGIHLHYRRTGSREAPMVVFANSLGTDLRIWDGVLDHLGSRIQSLCYDKRGHGLSDAPPAPYTIEDHASDLVELMAHEGIQKAVICGISVGGMIALGLAARRPKAINGLILCDTAHKIGTEELWNERIELVRRHGIEKLADAVLERWFSGDYRQTKPAEVAAWRNLLVRTPVEGYVGTCAALRDADLTQAARQLSVPAYCLVGSEDGATTPDLVRSMCDLIPGSRFQVIEGAGHLPCIEAPQEIASLISSLVQEYAS